MLKKFTLLLLVLAVSAVIAFNFGDNHKRDFSKVNRIEVKEDGSSSNNSSNIHRGPVVDYPPPPGAITGLKNYMDYATNGNSLSTIRVSGDTVVVATTYIDSSEATDGNNGVTMRIRYNYSYNRGNTWELATGIDMSTDRKTRYPDASYMTISGQRTILASGRIFLPPLNNAARSWGFSYDALLGLGSITLVPGIPPGNDLFSDWRPDGKIGGVYQSADTLYYITGDPATNAYSGKKFVYRTAYANTVSSYTLAAAKSGNHMTIAHVFINPDAPNLRFVGVHTSPDNGANWSPATQVLGTGVLNGDSTQPYWHEDIAYKPGTTDPYIVFSTTDYTTETNPLITRKSHKICIYSPALNSGNPVVIADWNNHPMLSDTANYNKIRTLHVNSVYLSHPSLGFTTDGNTMLVAYSAVQTDTAETGFTWEDIWTQYSTNGGLNWSTPSNRTNTQRFAEKYPSVAPTGNSSTEFFITYNYDSIPGCHAFNNSQVVDAVYFVLLKANPIGVRPISNEVPGAYSLNQNFPNPFNPSTKIQFSIPKSSNVTLKVYNVLGQQVAVLIGGDNLVAGKYEVDFNASNYGSGVYFYKLSTDDFSSVKKMVLTK